MKHSREYSIHGRSFLQASPKNSPSWLIENEPLIFWFMTILFLVPIWFSNFLPTQDGPAHLYNAHLLKNFLTGIPNDVVSGFYELNTNPTPTWFLHIILTGLQFFFSPSVAEKLVVTILILSLPAAARFAVGKIDQTMKPLAWLAFPMTYSLLFYHGFYGMCFSVPCFLFTFGAVLDYLRTGSSYSLFLITVGSLLCYVMHIIGLGLLGLAVVVLGIGWALMIWQNNVTILWGFVTSRLIPLGMTFLPALLLMVLFLGEKQSVLKSEFDLSHLFSRGQNLGLSGSLFSIIFTGPAALLSVGTIFSLLLFLLLAGMLRGRHLKLGMTRIMFAIFLLFCLLQLFLPQLFLVTPNNGMMGGGFISQRIALFITPVFILFLATCSNSINYFFNQFRIVLFFTVFILCFHSISIYHFNGYLKEYIAFGRHIQPDTLFMPLHFFPEEKLTIRGPLGIALRWRFDPLVHASNHIAMETGALSLDNYEPSMGYFPLLYRNDMNPETIGYVDCRLRSLYGDRPTVFKNLITHYKEKGFPVKYVLVWRMADAGLSEDLAMVLADSSTLIAESRHGQLYQINGETAVK
ncbi:MAG: hypothetical protein PF690_11255 [Deltaproteobacteria bacterium]|nr:hypothetical protein [Deltaproteobacteria bacterium]